MLLYSWLDKAVKEKGGARALIYRDTYLSWRGLLHRVNRRAQEFQGMGVRPGDFVGLMLGNVPDLVILSLALSKLRAAAVPLDPTTSTRELEMLMSIVPMRGLITRPRGGDSPLPNGSSGSNGGNGTAESADLATPRRRQVPESRKRLQGTLLSCSIYRCDERALPKRRADQIAVLLVTADSVGDPKPVERTSANLEAEAEHLSSVLELNRDDRVLLTIPLFQSFGFDIGMVGCFSVGATLCLEDELGPNRIVKLVREQKITVLPGGKTLFSEMARLPPWRPLSHKPVRMISSGGGLSGGALEAFEEKYGARPMACLHQTETGTVALDIKGQYGDGVGKVLPGVEVRTTDAKNHKPTSGGKVGVLWVRGGAVSPLQIGAPKGAALSSASAPAVGSLDGDGWYRTGDLATIDRAKRITLRGREDDLVRLDGKRIALGEVEGCIEALPKVSAAQAQLITDPLGGPMVVAKVVLKDRRGKVAPESIIDHCARNLAPYKVPRRVEICEAL